MGPPLSRGRSELKVGHFYGLVVRIRIRQRDLVGLLGADKGRGDRAHGLESSFRLAAPAGLQGARILGKVAVADVLQLVELYGIAAYVATPLSPIDSPIVLSIFLLLAFSTSTTIATQRTVVFKFFLAVFFVSAISF